MINLSQKDIPCTSPVASKIPSNPAEKPAVTSNENSTPIEKEVVRLSVTENEKLISVSQSLTFHKKANSLINPHVPDRFTPHAPVARKIADQR